MKASVLRSRALRNTLEVEDILRAAVSGTPGLAEELEALVEQCGWLSVDDPGCATRVIPFRSWAEVAIAYTRGGEDSLVQLVRTSPSLHSFVYALLEEIHARTSVSVLQRIDSEVLKDPASDVARARQVASTINLLLSFPSSIEVTREERALFRTFLHRLLPLCGEQKDRALVALALRGVGDHTSVAVLERLPPFTAPWTESAAKAIKAIKKRGKKAAQPGATDNLDGA